MGPFLHSMQLDGVLPKEVPRGGIFLKSTHIKYEVDMNNVVIVSLLYFTTLAHGIRMTISTFPSLRISSPLVLRVFAIKRNHANQQCISSTILRCLEYNIPFPMFRDTGRSVYSLTSKMEVSQ